MRTALPSQFRKATTRDVWGLDSHQLDLDVYYRNGYNEQKIALLLQEISLVKRLLWKKKAAIKGRPEESGMRNS